MRIALVGTRGPGRYGGFETCVEEVGARLHDRGHEVVVYCRGMTDLGESYRGMRLVHLPALRRKSLETLSHTALSAGHLFRHRVDVAIMFNAANSPWLPVLRAARIPAACHVDGLEWRRAKWGGVGQRYYRVAEALAVRWSDALISDSYGITDYYAQEFGAPTERILYGAPILPDPRPDLLTQLGLEPSGFHLVVARWEPENNVELAVRGYVASAATRPLVVVGSAPYADEYSAAVHAAAGDDPRVRFPGAIWDQDLLNSLYANGLTYLHGHSVGGTNPSLLRAIGAGAAVLAYDVTFNREVCGDNGVYFRTVEDLTALYNAAEADPQAERDRGQRLRERAKDYDWDEVAAGYEALCRKLFDGYSIRRKASGRRSHRWTEAALEGDPRRPGGAAGGGTPGGA